ncbi:hypothetical protein AMATHDRAFT_139412 [Amanita thiersii Skay4041]|uniref:Uncharacterized protein n=1 Tax=Amanita thiersii Skay4041 TaxID=703135 RepID=A0A2A9NYA7_9AGAR|nr:hypothetical protein AMATHDRAFT_139412 [Amanita thiersii Skay4041]
MMSTNILDPSALISSLPALLPPAAKSLNSIHDAIAALLHATMSALSFRLVAVDQSSHSSDNQSNTLPPEWNKNGPEVYTFRYKHHQSSLEFLVKIISLGRRTIVNAVSLESDRVATLDIATSDFTSPSFFPHDAGSTSQPLIHGYISSNRVTDLVGQYKLAIVQKVMPGLRKDGYTEEVEVTSETPASSRNPPPARPQPIPPPEGPARNPQDVQPPLPENPLEIGRRDREPFPINPFAPPSLFPPGSGDGMFVGPEHPIFGRRRDDIFGRQGPWGGDGFLPPLGAPPGARFDPVGPGPQAGRGPNGRGVPGSGNMRDPDNDEFMPPGMVSDMDSTSRDDTE